MQSTQATPETKKCSHCGKLFSRRKREWFPHFVARLYCSRRCAGLALNQRLPSNEFKARYRQIKTPDGRRMLEHRWVMEQHIGRKLLRSEQVHHINHDRLDNRIENLELVSSYEHGLRHTVLPTEKICVVCGSQFTPSKNKRRSAITCGAKACVDQRLSGEHVGNAKLSDAQVREIRAKRRAGALLRELSSEYKVTESNISSICRGESRKHA